MEILRANALDDECEDGETNNENPCNPWDCIDGQWYEIIIDCPEQEGIPCEGGEYVPPAEGECCSVCVENDCEEVFNEGYELGAQSGDVNLDGQANVLDIVLMIDNILNP
jgi:hypothetical protein